jgi:hypothetical protein|tara:strand:+ start:752 stop:859 length:108 start_codon:yes stop_codon:yes gene_type:complete
MIKQVGRGYEEIMGILEGILHMMICEIHLSATSPA